MPTGRPGSSSFREHHRTIRKGVSPMSEVDELRATVARLADRVRALEDHVEIMQLAAQYGPAVDSGSGEAAAALWTEDGVFDAVPHRRMRGRGDIIGMVGGDGHQSLLSDGCGHVLTVPH